MNIQKPTVIAFRILDASLRGTEVAIYDYAQANEEILGNISIIIVNNQGINNTLVLHKFRSRFIVYFYNTIEDIEKILKNNNCKVLYTIGYGRRSVNNPTLSINNIYKTALHCVFTLDDPHANTYIPISKYLLNRYPKNDNSINQFVDNFVPHMINGPTHDEFEKYHNLGLSFRKSLNIPNDALVFGRHGGIETFNLPFVKELIRELIDYEECQNHYYIFVNTEIFIIHPRIIFLDPIVNFKDKYMLIFGCDAMIHARMNGETFGIACGEFSVCNKPVITYNGYEFGDFYDRAHLEILGNRCITYNSKDELRNVLLNFEEIKKEKEKVLNINNFSDIKNINVWDAYSEYYNKEVVIRQWWDYLIKPLL